MLRISPLGALNGLRIRSWFADPDAPDLRDVAATYGVNLVETPLTNCVETRQLLAEANADLGVSLGNSLIGPSVFSIPGYGMVNVHMELLPEVRGGRSVLWQIFSKSTHTGFTIHQVDRSLDTGEILYQERHAIRLWPTLAETVRETLAAMRDRIPDALRRVCEDYPTLKVKSIPQGTGKSYTTPTFRQFLVMLKNHRDMYRAAQEKP